MPTKLTALELMRRLKREGKYAEYCALRKRYLLAQAKAYTEPELQAESWAERYLYQRAF